jgi:hypothetical protein
MKTNIAKSMLVVLFSIGLAMGASAQRSVHYSGGGGIHGGGGVVYHGGGGVYAYPRTYIGLGLGFGYGYYPYGLYGPWGYPYPPYYYGYGAMPSQLAMQIEDIKNDYNAQIKDTRHDKSIPRKERRAKIDQLKHDRDEAVIQARKDYFYRNYKNSRQPRTYKGDDQPQPNNTTPKPDNSQRDNSEQPEYQTKPTTNTNTQQ